jgi:two-component system cell cycle response regulator CtrA
MSPFAVADEVPAAVEMRGFSSNRQSTIQTGDLVVDIATRVVSVDGKPVRLTGKEYQILELLSLRKGITVTKEMFLGHLYGGLDEPELKIIDVFVCHLRKKLTVATGGKHYIQTVWGRGYRLPDPGQVLSLPHPWRRTTTRSGRRTGFDSIDEGSPLYCAGPSTG